MQRRSARALSSGDLIAYKKAALLLRKRAPDQPVHSIKESLLTSESGFTNFRGLINWGMIMLFVFGGKMFLQNLINNGIMVDPSVWRYLLTGEHTKPGGMLFLACANVFILFGFALELIFERYRVTHLVALSLVILNQIGIVLFPTVVILMNDWNPFFTSPCSALYTVIFLKMWSYAQVNAWCRSARRKKNNAASKGMDDLFKNEYTVLKKKRESEARGKMVRALSTVREPKGLKNVEPPKVEPVQEEGDSGVGSPVNEKELQEEPGIEFEVLEKDEIIVQMTEYPDNLTLRDLYYFMFAPTLCYELNFPRIFSIRKRFLLKRLFELLCLSQVIVMLVQQWMVPGLKSSVSPFIRSRWIYTLERLLSIAIPNHVIWLLSFYALFHAFLNVVAELLLFADRSFYEDWWNAGSVSAFWSSWNIPVHRWCRRHIYKPMLIRGYKRSTASVVVFFVSAFFHEFMVSVPLKMFRLWAFLGMLGQQPYAILVHYYCPKGGKLGNMAVWLTLILGQPLALYMYFHDYYFLHFR